MDYRNYVDFVNLDGGYETFELDESLGVKSSGGQDARGGSEAAGRGWEILCRTAKGRWVLVFVIPPGHEEEEDIYPVNRELTSSQVARWCRLNGLALPAGFEPVALNDDAECRIGQARLDRDWTPPQRPYEAPTQQAETTRDRVVSRPPEEALPGPEASTPGPEASTPGPEASPSGPSGPPVTTQPVQGPGCELPGEATPASPPQPPVVLHGPDKKPIGQGREKQRLSKARYDVVKALLDHGPLGKDDLDRKSGHQDARKLLKALADGDPDWKAVIIFPEVYGAGYNIRR
jgi:hypothetical protein